MNKIVELYADGYELVEITEELNCSNEEILNAIVEYKDSCKLTRGKSSFTFNEDFKDLLVNRYQSGFSLYSISQELNLSTSTVSKYLKSAGVDTKKRDNKDYEVIDWNHFDQCPTCKSKSFVRTIGSHNQDEPKTKPRKHSFCFSCETEWYREEKQTRKVLWYAIK